MNKSNIFFVLSLIVLSSNLSIGQTAQKLNYIYDCEDKICEEYLNLDSSEVINFDVDNKIYKENIEFIFTYKYVQDGKEFLIGNKGHSLISIDSVDDQTITEVAFYCSKKDGDLMRKFLPNYKQSGVAYNYYNNNGVSFEPKEGSGLKENEMNVWIHPFRRATYFAMLNINPYPYVKYPISVGDVYKWELKVGGNTYTNPIWAEWAGSTNRKHNYKVVSKVAKDYRFAKDVKVYHIQATSTSEIGESSADFWFSKEFGFVEMNYTNINGTKFNFKLDRIILRK